MQEYKKRMKQLFSLIAFDILIIALLYVLVVEVFSIEKTNSLVYFILGAFFSSVLTYSTVKELK